MSTKRRSVTVFGACWVCESGLFKGHFSLLPGDKKHEAIKTGKIEAETAGILDVVWMGFISTDRVATSNVFCYINMCMYDWGLAWRMAKIIQGEEKSLGKHLNQCASISVINIIAVIVISQ